MSKRKNERSLIPLMSVIGLVSAPLIFILGIVAGSQIQLSSILTADSLSSWVSALATVAIAVLTFILAKETWYLREAQIEQGNSLRKEKKTKWGQILTSDIKLMWQPYKRLLKCWWLTS